MGLTVASKTLWGSIFLFYNPMNLDYLDGGGVRVRTCQTAQTESDKSEELNGLLGKRGRKISPGQNTNCPGLTVKDLLL